MFGRGGHLYFGTKDEVEIAGCKLNAYSYLDHLNMSLRTGEWIASHSEKYDGMT